MGVAFFFNPGYKGILKTGDFSMKFIRFTPDANNTYYGVVGSQEDKRARIVKGSIFEAFSVTEKSDMIFDVPTLVSHLSRSMTLMPGTVILTGTPPGVGFTRKPPLFLREGDRVTVSIEKIGRLINPVVREK
jgi:hypothetical protein